MLSVVAVGPAIERAVFDLGDVIRHQVAAQFVALVHRRPQGAAVGLPGQAVGVAQARGEQAFAAAGALDLPDRGTAFLYFHAVFADVAVGADGDVQVLAVGAGDDVLGPVVIEACR